MPIPSLRDTQFRIRRIGEKVSKHLDRPERSGKKNILHWLRANWLIILAVVIVLFILGGVGVFAWVSRDLPDPNKMIDRTVAQSTRIYARDGTTLLYEIHGSQNRTIINLEDIPAYAKEATIAIEDKDFYRHHGFSVTGIIKGVCHEALGNLGGLCPPRGGSTITQQLVKNAILTSEHSYIRKLKELILAYQIESRFTKDQILKMYLNEIPYGSTAYGIESAAQKFLGKPAKNLKLSEAAFLAALPQIPSYYSPYGTHTDALSKRVHLILDEMVIQGYITKVQADEAKQDNVLARVKPKRESIEAPHFVMYVKELLADKYGEAMVEQGGLKVVTTLNIDKQRIAEEVVTKYADKNTKNYNATNAALVSLDSKTGQILAMIGSKDYFDESIDGNVNVTLRPRQPGSSFKPFVYLTAFQKGYTPETVLFDLVTNFKTDTGDYTPHNYDSKEHGPLTMRQTLAGSLNIPAVKTLYLAGIDNVLDNAEKLGYTTLSDRSRFGLSLVLGGGDVTLLEHTSAFATLAREGVRHPTSAILRVEDSRGKVLEEYQNREERVVDNNSARLVTSILSDNSARAYIFGERNYLTLPDRPVAAKTGTTNDYKDAWTMGYTPSTATGVWVGNSDGSVMKRGADGSIVAAPIWNEYMKRTVGGPAEPFKAPKPNDANKPVLQGKTGSAIIYNVDIYTKKIIPDSCLATYPKEFIVHKTYKEAHDILYYVDKSNPRGPVPTDPTKDPQYTRWEDPVKRWAQANSYTETKPANESCDLRAEKNRPVVTILSPTNGATISTPSFIISASATATRPVQKVGFYIDDILIGEPTTAPFELNYTATGLISGFHDLKVTAYDDVANQSSVSTTFNYLIGPPPETSPGQPTDPLINTNAN